MKTLENLMSRRLFLANSSKAGVAMGLVGTGIFTACSNDVKGDEKAILATSFTQTPLAYDYAGLEPNIDAKTMEIHYTKHAASYASNLNTAIGEENVDTNKPLEEVLGNISKYSEKMRNNAGGHYNHELFWKVMSPDGGGEPTGALAEAINNDLGGFSTFKTEFENAAKTRFGSGWAWLVWKDNKLSIGSTPNQDNPLMDVSDFKGIPLLGVDVWEHAYYLKYTSDRPGYLTNWWNVVNWSAVADRLSAVK